MANVYFYAIDSYTQTQYIQDSAKKLLKTLVEQENVQLETYLPLKVHFGEKGNRTFIEPQNFEGIIDYLHEQNIQSTFIETNVLYRGERMTRSKHIKLAHEHGFTQLPVTIADGEVGDDYEDVEIGKKHFTHCKIGREIAKQSQLIVLSHFKGHLLAGFGGTLKQLAMGCASRGGKLAQHANAKPLINPFTCKKCGACAAHCPVDAIHLGWLPRIHHATCIGCASCIAVCPHGAIMFNPLRASLAGTFQEKLAEYALAAQLNKANIYITFAFNITSNCDCNGRVMTAITPDAGILASTDPVALDQACLDVLDHNAGKKVFRRGRHILEYAEQIGLGHREYNRVDMS